MDVIVVALGLAVAAIAVYLYFSRGGTVDTLEKVAEEAYKWVQIAEQMHKNGQLPEGDANEVKRDFVAAQLQKLFPKVDVDTILGYLEYGFVMWKKHQAWDRDFKDE
jgi:hypothetical protein